MLATASRGVNGRLRQQPFGAGAALIKKDQAPFRKKDKGRKLDFKKSQPVLFSPLGRVSSDMRQSNNSLAHVPFAKKPTSKSRIKKNHSIELSAIYEETQPLREAIDALATRPGGPYGEFREGTGRSANALCEGDLVLFLNEKGDYGVVIMATEVVKLCLSLSGEMQAFRQADVIVRFPNFIDEEAARRACPVAIDSSDLSNEPFDQARYEVRARICKQLNVLQRQIESNTQKLMPAFEDLFLSSASQDHLKEEIIRTPDVARRLIGHPLFPKVRQHSLGAADEEQGENEWDAEEELAHEIAELENDFQHAYTDLDKVGVASLVEGNVSKVTADSPAVLLATHQLLFSNTQLFQFDQLRHSETQTFAVRPLAERKALTRVKSWAESALTDVSRGNKRGDNPIRVFAEKAKKLMKLRQEERLEVSADLPGVPRALDATSSQAGLSWSSDDCVIIQALRAASGHQYRPGTRDNLTSLILFIVKECGLGSILSTTPMGQEADHQSRIGSKTPQTMCVDLLVRLGFVAPWENIPNMDTEFRQMIAQDDGAVEGTIVPSRADPDEAIRKDFDLPVYVIDDASAYELDDGISIEAAARKDQYWIHISVADPTTMLDINDPIAKLAQRRHNSIYSPDGHWSMLPSAITRQYGLRVDDKGDGKGHANALQFSALLDFRSRKVQEIDVRLARLKDVRIMSYDQVDDVLEGTDMAIDGRAQKDLKLLHQAAIALEERRRVIGGALIAPGSGASITLDPLPLPASPVWQVTDDFAPRTPIFAGFPTIKFRPYSAIQAGIGPKFSLSHGLVAELMITANRVASEWYSRQKIPALFGGQAAPSKEDQRKLYELRDEDGIVTYQKLLQSGVIFSSGATSVQQTEHFSLGVNTARALKSNNKDALSAAGYSRVTSPLRRYPDLLNHWQIKQSLRKGSGAAPLVSREELLDLIPRQDRMNAWFKLSERNASRFYFALKLMRGAQSRRGEVQLPPQEKKEVDAIFDATHEALVSIAEVRIRSATHARVRVQLMGLGASAEMKWDPTVVEAPPRGTKYQVKITQVYLAGSTGFIEVERV